MISVRTTCTNECNVGRVAVRFSATQIMKLDGLAAGNQLPCTVNGMFTGSSACATVFIVFASAKIKTDLSVAPL